MIGYKDGFISTNQTDFLHGLSCTSNHSGKSIEQKRSKAFLFLRKIKKQNNITSLFFFSEFSTIQLTAFEQGTPPHLNFRISMGSISFLGNRSPKVCKFSKNYILVYYVLVSMVCILGAMPPTGWPTALQFSPMMLSLPTGLKIEGPVG